MPEALKIAINARLLHDPALRGWSRYTVNLLAELPPLGVELYLYGDKPLHPAHLARLPADSYQVRIQEMRYPLWEQFWLPRQCARDGVAVLHCPSNFGLPWTSPCLRVLTLHDAIDQVYGGNHLSWRNLLRPARWRSPLHHWVARRRAHHVITGSEHARGDLIRYLGLDPERVSVIFDGTDPRFYKPCSPQDRSRVRSDHVLTKPYFFYIGGWERRKNVPFLLRAFAAANLGDVELVLAGGRDQERQTLIEQAETLGIGKRLRLLGWVEDEDLTALYAEALAFVYPSEYEGFGLQLCEAMACGCPVLASDRTSLPEILGQGGETFPLEDPGPLASLLRRVHGEEAFRDDLRARGQKRGAEFSWKRTAEQTVAVYRTLLEGGGRAGVKQPAAAIPAS